LRVRAQNFEAMRDYFAQLSTIVNILGISAFYHDSAAALIQDGHILAAAQEERFTRHKHDASFPIEAIRFCLRQSVCSLRNIDYVVFYDKPFSTFDRLLETYLAFAPKGFLSFRAAMPVWLKDRLYLKSVLRDELSKLGGLKSADLPPYSLTSIIAPTPPQHFLPVRSRMLEFCAWMALANGRRPLRGWGKDVS
jgi:hypothetical protein